MDGYEDDLPASEAAREKRRDRDAEAHTREGMRTGLAKQFKQVLDTQVKRARDAEQRTPAEPDGEERKGKRPPAHRRKP
jgi:hypothetical protein